MATSCEFPLDVMDLDAPDEEDARIDDLLLHAPELIQGEVYLHHQIMAQGEHGWGPRLDSDTTIRHENTHELRVFLDSVVEHESHGRNEAVARQVILQKLLRARWWVGLAIYLHYDVREG